MKTPDRPVMRYFGGKWKIADWIISFFPEHKTYVEPFGGAASVLMKKKPAKTEVYNDLNDEIFNLFQVLRHPKQSKKLIELLDLTPYSRTEWENAHLPANEPVEQARRTIVLSVMSHNASKMYRRQRNGFRSCSSGYHRLPLDFINSTENLKDVIKRLKNVLVEKRDAVELMKQHDGEQTLFYVDPPYLKETRTATTGFYKHEMLTAESHEKLAKTLLNVKGFVILSGYRSDYYKEWFEGNGWTAYQKKAISGAAKKGKSDRVEVIWLNPKTQEVQKQLKIF